MRRDELIAALEELDHIQDVLDSTPSDTRRMNDNVDGLRWFLRRELHEIETRLFSRAQLNMQATGGAQDESNLDEHRAASA